MSEVLYRLEQSILNEPDSFSMYKDDLLGWIELLKEKQPQLNENQQIVIDLEMSDCSVEVTGWNYPDELDTENLSYLFSNVLENARALEQEEE
ncbi:hypothetical protein [Enterococcus sp. N249-2]